MSINNIVADRRMAQKLAEEVIQYIKNKRGAGRSTYTVGRISMDRSNCVELNQLVEECKKTGSQEAKSRIVEIYTPHVEQMAESAAGCSKEDRVQSLLSELCENVEIVNGTNRKQGQYLRQKINNSRPSPEDYPLFDNEQCFQ